MKNSLYSCIIEFFSYIFLKSLVDNYHKYSKFTHVCIYADQVNKIIRHPISFLMYLVGLVLPPLLSLFISLTLPNLIKCSNFLPSWHLDPAISHSRLSQHWLAFTFLISVGTLCCKNIEKFEAMTNKEKKTWDVCISVFVLPHSQDVF